jgi:citrate lyase beta subunit
MLIVSQNALNHNIQFPDSTVYRINLAWINNIQELETLLTKYNRQSIFLDLPKGRVKPPNNRYTLEDLFNILNVHKNIRYFAISNVNSPDDLNVYKKAIPAEIVLVPKIESPTGVLNIKNIVDAIPTSEKILMLDHDDLYSSLIKNKEPSSKFTEYIQTLSDFCNENNVSLLRTIGVIFSDDEKRTTQYVQ